MWLGAVVPTSKIERDPATLRAFVVDSVGDVEGRGDIGRVESHEDFAGYTVALSVFCCPVGPHVPAADQCREASNFFTVGRDGDRPVDLDERKRRYLVVDHERGTALAFERPGLPGAGASVEHHVVAVENEPDGCDMGRAVRSHPSDLSGSRAGQEKVTNSVIGD